jgi:hypothetical protein
MMKIIRILSGGLLALAIAAHSHGQTIFNCSAFNSGAGTCGASGSNNTLGANNFKLNSTTTTSITGSGQVQLAPAHSSHTAMSANFTTPVNVQAFSTTYTFIPSGNTLAFVLQNTNNQPGYQGIGFFNGAGCEGGFYQAPNVTLSGTYLNNVFAITMDGFNNVDPVANGPFANGFTYSTTNLYTSGYDPCHPNDGDPGYRSYASFVTNPVPLNSPATQFNTTTGHVYSVTITYDGSNLIENLFDVTAGGTCPGPSCFTHTWTGVNIPSIVGGSNTALAGITASTVSAGNAGAVLINSWSYTQGTPPPAVAITANQSQYGWQVLPGDVRRIYATITNGTTNKVNWSVASTTGGASATLSATANTFPWVDVTVGSTPGTCSVSPGSGSGNVTYTATSTAIVTIRAQSVDDTSKTVDFPIDVCQPSTQVIVTPFYEALYANQKVDLQTWVLGNSNQAVTWAITSQPGGGDGILSDITNRDTVFSATVAGRYTVLATSVADGTKTQTATLYVTGHALPYPVTPSQTMPVDCTADPSSTGTVYDVGPTQATYHTITSVPWTALTAGSTVRIHNEDLSGSSPTTYHEYFPFSGTGTRTQPIRVCGVPDSAGNLPVIDGQNATPAISTSFAYTIEQYAAVSVGGNYSTNWWGNYAPGPWTGPQYLILEGLAIKNASSSVSHTAPGGTVANWALATSGLRVWPSMDTVIRGNDVSNSDFGIFSDFNTNNGWALVQNTDYEGNHVHGTGVSGNGSIHQFYLQGWLQLVQFNVIDKMLFNSGGINLKDRGVGTIVRYNYFGDGAGGTPNSPQRVIDAVDNQDSPQYMGAYNYIPNGWAQGNIMTMDLMTAWYDQFHTYHIYGNIIQNSTALFGVHFIGDHGPYGAARPGNLYFYNNTLSFTGTFLGSGILDTNDNGGGTPFEYPRVMAQNNIIWQTPGTSACWNSTETFVSDFTTNVVAAGSLMNITTPISPSSACNLNSGWESTRSDLPLFTSVTPINNHITGLSSGNFISTASQPFTTGTYVPVSPQSGTGLSGGAANMPVRFQFNANTHYATARSTVVTSSTGGIIGAVDNSTPTVATPTFSPTAGTYTSIQTVTISDTTPSSTIYYTLDGSTPTTGSTVYSGAITLNSNTTVKAIATAAGFVTSSVGSAAYTINLPGLWNSLTGWNTCIKPGCDPGGTGIPVSTNQTIRNASPSLSGSSMQMSMVANQPDTNVLFYWLAPVCDLCTNFASDFEVYLPSTSNLGALELDTAFLFSVGLNREYMFGWQYCYNGAGCPGGHNSWDAWDQATIQWIDSGVTQAPLIGWNHITTTDHRVGNSQVYDTFVLNGTVHNLGITTNSGVLPMGWTSGNGFQFQMDANTPSGSQTYFINLDQASFTASTAPIAVTPTFSPVAGTYTGTQTVTISTTSGSVICYNTTGSPATDGATGCTTGTKYTAPVSVAASETLYAVAGGTGFQDSTAGSAAYTINAPVVATPVTSPNAGTYTSTQTVALSDTTPASTIYYTTNGSTPTTGSTVYSSPLTVSTTQTVKAIASASGFTNSSVGSSLYTINIPPTLTSIVVTPAGTSVVVGSTKQYTATCHWSDSTTTNCTSTVTWSSTFTSIATISAGGLATGVLAGSTTIMATSSSVSGSTGLTVTNPTTHGSKGHGGHFKGSVLR